MDKQNCDCLYCTGIRSAVNMQIPYYNYDLTSTHVGIRTENTKPMNTNTTDDTNTSLGTTETQSPEYTQQRHAQGGTVPQNP